MRNYSIIARFLLVSIAAVGLVLLLKPSMAGSQDEEASSTSSIVEDFHKVRGRQPHAKTDGLYEGELHLEQMGTARAQGMRAYGTDWSGDAHLLWDGVVGDSMQTSFRVDEAGTYDIEIQLTLAPDYGQFRLSINDFRYPEMIDLYSSSIELAEMVRMKDVSLESGRQVVQFELVGGNENGHHFREDRYLNGIDFIRISRVDAPEANTDELQSQEVIEDERPSALSIIELNKTLSNYCADCHLSEGGVDVEGGFDLSQFPDRHAYLTQIETTRDLRDVMVRHEMPPEEETQPSEQLRRRVAATLDEVIDEYLATKRSTSPILMRRMNRFEFNNAVKDLLDLRGDIYPLPEKTIRADRSYFDPASGRFPDAVLVGNRTLGKNQVEKQVLTGVSPFAIDLQAEGGFNNRGEELSVSPLLFESMLKLSQAIVNAPEFDDYCRLSPTLFSRPKEAEQIGEQSDYARQQLLVFLERAFREAIDEETLDRYHRFVIHRLESGITYRQSMKEVVAAVLASPRFLFIAGADNTAPNSVSSAYDLADRLAFFLWSSIPDEELIALARDGSLHEVDVLDAQVQRMLEHPRSQALSQNFARQWLGLDQLITAVPDYERFPRYYSRIGCEQWKFGLQTMIEPLLLFESVMVEDRSIMLLIDSNYTFRSDELQSWYQEETPFADRENRGRFNTNQQAYRRVRLDDRRQGGVITSAATLTMTSSPLRTSPIVRGAWVATVVFNQPPPPPPDDVPEIEQDDQEIESKGMTLRQRLIQHQVNQSCAACHSKIDPLGFALENYDAVGRWRDTYTSGLAIDASGVLFGAEPFGDVVELKDAILRNPEWFMRAFSEHMLAYALGRELELDDQPAIDEIAARVLADRGQFTSVVRAIVASHAFRYGRLDANSSEGIQVEEIE